MYNEYYPEYLYHYGVKGMKWGVKRAQKLQNKARIARDSAKEWDEMANYAAQRGKTKRAEKYAAYAKQDLADANKYQQKANKKVENRYAKAGKAAGKADYMSDRAKQVERKHEQGASAFDKMANKYESEGKYLKAEAARSSANALRARGKNASADYHRAAEAYLKQSNKLTKKASEFSSATNINIGKSKVDSIIASSKQKGYNNAKAGDEMQREREIESRYGSDALNVYRKIQGK